MTHRERVLTTLSHQEPDRVPLDLWGSDSRLLNQFYFKVLDYLGWKATGEKLRPGQIVACEIVAAKGYDLIGVAV